jgi:hypothetical protein
LDAEVLKAWRPGEEQAYTSGNLQIGAAFKNLSTTTRKTTAGGANGLAGKLLAEMHSGNGWKMRCRGRFRVGPASTRRQTKAPLAIATAAPTAAAGSVSLHGLSKPDREVVTALVALLRHHGEHALSPGLLGVDAETLAAWLKLPGPTLALYAMDTSGALSADDVLRGVAVARAAAAIKAGIAAEPGGNGGAQVQKKQKY